MNNLSELAHKLERQSANLATNLKYLDLTKDAGFDTESSRELSRFFLEVLRAVLADIETEVGTVVNND